MILWLVGFQCAAEPYDHFSGVMATARRSVPPALSVQKGAVVACTIPGLVKIKVVKNPAQRDPEERTESVPAR